MNRRQFFRFTAGAAAAAGAWSIVPSPASAAPVLIGDGEHDDGPALNAALAGRLFEDRNGLCQIPAGFLLITGGVLRANETLRLSGVTHVNFGGARINSYADVALDATAWRSGGTLMNVEIAGMRRQGSPQTALVLGGREGA